ncbi:MAG: hypothetical protein KTR15_08180 [Phycisphaeraceae bacterium]|nr:hypothetical protein [Phycisphaeraceae bacterium]
MSIKDRIEDARFMYQNGRKDAALLSILVAIAATSRKRYPRELIGRDGDAFTKFLKEELLVVSGGSAKNFYFKVPGSDIRKYPDSMMPLENIFYEVVRCNLVHEEVIPTNVQFISDGNPGWSIEITDDKLELSDSWIGGLDKVVEYAPENTEEFPHVAELPPEVLGWVLFKQRRKSRCQYLAHRYMRVKKLHPKS